MKPEWLLVSPVCGGAVSVAIGVLSAFDALGIPLAIYDSGEAFRRLVGGDWNRYKEAVAMMREELLRIVPEIAPRRIIALDPEPLDAATIEKLRGRVSGTKFAHWFVEDHSEGVGAWWPEIAAADDVFFAVEKSGFETKARGMGVRFEWLPNACHMVASLDLLGARSGVAFVGSARPGRIEIFRSIIQAGIDVRLYGPHWSQQNDLASNVAVDGWVGEDAEAEAYRNALLVVNIHDGGPGTAMVNPRTFTAAGQGALVLLEPRDDLPELFSSDEVALAPREKLAEMAQRLLRQPEKIRLRGAKAALRVAKEHRYTNRIARIAEVLDR